MVERLRQAFTLAERQSERQQEALATLLLEEMDDEDRWDALFADLRSAGLLARLVGEAKRDDQAQRVELIAGDTFLS
jgi:hypothetical protein